MKIKLKANYVVPIVILLLGFILMRFLFSFEEEAPKKKPEIRTKIVESKLVRFSNVKSEISTLGRLLSAQPIVLTSEVSGEVMRGEISFLPGQKFYEGDLIVKIDDRQIMLDINSAKSDFLTALATVLPEIKIDFPEEFEKWQLYFNKCVFNKMLDDIPDPANQKIKLLLARFNVYKLFFAVKNLEIKLEKHYFYAPFNGSIINADLRIGSTARSGTRLGEIINLDDMELTVPIPTVDMRWIDNSKPVVITSNEIEGTWFGKIKRVGETINTQTQTLQAFLSINKSVSSDLYNGVFLNVKIPGKTIQNALSIPRKALYNENYVYVINHGKLNFNKVEVARIENNNVIITGGVAEGDTLVTEVMQGVAPGMPAKPIFYQDEEGDIE